MTFFLLKFHHCRSSSLNFMRVWSKIAHSRMLKKYRFLASIWSHHFWINLATDDGLVKNIMKIGCHLRLHQITSYSRPILQWWSTFMKKVVQVKLHHLWILKKNLLKGKMTVHKKQTTWPTLKKFWYKKCQSILYKT